MYCILEHADQGNCFSNGKKIGWTQDLRSKKFFFFYVMHQFRINKFDPIFCKKKNYLLYNTNLGGRHASGQSPDKTLRRHSCRLRKTKFIFLFI